MLQAQADMISVAQECLQLKYQAHLDEEVGRERSFF